MTSKRIKCLRELISIVSCVLSSKVGPVKGNEKEDLHLKTGLEHSTLIGIQEEESDKKYVGQPTLQ